MAFKYPKSRLLAVSTLFACVLGIASVISIPIPGPVPITLQVFVVYLIAMVLGPKAGTLSCLIYVLFGVLGLPVFAGLTSGLSVLIGPTGGYLLGFVPGSFMGGIVCRRRGSSKRNDLIRLCLCAVTVLFVIYSMGVLWLSFYVGGNVLHAFELGAVPFVPLDILKAVVALPIALQIRWSHFGIPIAI